MGRGTGKCRARASAIPGGLLSPHPRPREVQVLLDPVMVQDETDLSKESLASATAQLGSTTVFWMRKKKTDAKDYFLETHIIWTSSQVREKHHGRSSFVVSQTLPGFSLAEHTTAVKKMSVGMAMTVCSHTVSCVCVTPSLNNMFLNSPLGLEGPKVSRQWSWWPELFMQSERARVRRQGTRSLLK